MKGEWVMTPREGVYQKGIALVALPVTEADSPRSEGCVLFFLPTYLVLYIFFTPELFTLILWGQGDCWWLYDLVVTAVHGSTQSVRMRARPITSSMSLSSANRLLHPVPRYMNPGAPVSTMNGIGTTSVSPIDNGRTTAHR